MARRKSKRKTKKPPKLEPWVLEASGIFIGTGKPGEKKRMLAGYITAYVLSFLGVFHRRFGVFPTVQEIQRVFGYSQPNKPREQIRRLEDEGYVRLDETRCFVVEILKAPYYCPRPDFFQERINAYNRRFGLSPAPEEREGGNP